MKIDTEQLKNDPVIHDKKKVIDEKNQKIFTNPENENEKIKVPKDTVELLNEANKWILRIIV